MTTNYIGFETEKAQKVIENLNGILADYEVYYQNLRAVHWNVKGKQFLALHQEFEKLYTSAAESIDEIAERILTLGGTPFHTFEEFINSSSMKVLRNLSGTEETAEGALENISHLVVKLRESEKVADENGDNVTADLVTSIGGALEKEAWMLKSFLS